MMRMALPSGTTASIKENDRDPKYYVKVRLAIAEGVGKFVLVLLPSS
jgi:hypothetical protein